MECIQAQQILSQAADGEPTAPEVLAEARAHCDGCPECARFAAGLETLSRARLPEPSAALHERVMAALSKEATSARNESTTEHLNAAGHSELTSVPGVADLTMAAPRSARGRVEPWKVAAWVGAAAVVLVVIGFAAVSGLQGGAGSQTARQASGTQEDAASPESLASAPVGAPQDATKESSDAVAGVAPPAASQPPDAITLDGIVYSSVPASDYAASQLANAGTVTTSLDRGGTPVSYPVFATPVPGRVVIDASGEMLAFELVTRTLKGDVYRLTSKPIESFGVWPTLPAGFTQPTTADGAPTFVKGASDDIGVQTYLNPGTPIEQGFAIAPATATTDPAAGNPNWTWWTRAPQ